MAADDADSSTQSIESIEQQLELEQLQETRESLHVIRSESIGLNTQLRITGEFGRMQLAEVENALNTLEAAKEIVEDRMKEVERGDE